MLRPTAAELKSKSNSKMVNKDIGTLRPVSTIPAEIISKISSEILLNRIPDLSVLRCNLAEIFPGITVTDLLLYEDKVKDKTAMVDLYCDIFSTLRECNLKEVDINLFNIFTNKYQMEPLHLPQKPEPELVTENSTNLIDAIIQMTMTGVFVCIFSYLALSYLIPIFLPEFNQNIIPGITGVITFLMMCVQGTGLMAKDIRSLHKYNQYLLNLDGDEKYEQ